MLASPPDYISFFPPECITNSSDELVPEISVILGMGGGLLGWTDSEICVTCEFLMHNLQLAIDRLEIGDVH